jgi:hypothetical protein
MLRKSRFRMALQSAVAAAAFVAIAGSAHAAGFTNGDFETGDFTGWTQGSGYWGYGYGGTYAPYGTGAGQYFTGPGGNLTPDLFVPGGTYYNASAGVFTITNPGGDPNTGGALNMVYSGNHSAKLNDNNNNYSVSVIKQTVANYTDTNVYFAWAAVLEGSHGLTDSDNFTLTLTDDTKGITLYSASYSSASAAGSSLFNDYFGNYYTDWQVQNLDVSAYTGDTFTLELLGADCPYGGHWGYVYLDGFGSAPPTPGVPEPASMALLGVGLLGAGIVHRRRRAG